MNYHRKFETPETIGDILAGGLDAQGRDAIRENVGRAIFQYREIKREEGEKALTTRWDPLPHKKAAQAASWKVMILCRILNALEKTAAHPSPRIP